MVQLSRLLILLVSAGLWLSNGAQAQSRDQIERDVIQYYDEVMGKKIEKMTDEADRKSAIRMAESSLKNIEILITGKGAKDALGDDVDYEALGDSHEIATQSAGKVALKKAKAELTSQIAKLKDFKVPDYAICYSAILQVTEALTGKWTFKEKVAYPRQEGRCDDAAGLLTEKAAKEKDQLRPYLAEVKKLCTGGAVGYFTSPWGMNENVRPKERTANLRCVEKVHRKGVI